jgi:hypothetical protein
VADVREVVEGVKIGNRNENPERKPAPMNFLSAGVEPALNS